METPLSRSFRGRDFLTLHDYTTEELLHVLRFAESLKAEPHSPVLKGKALGMIFAKSSTRTRVSFEVGMYQLGGYALFLSQQDIQLGRGESIADTARVLSRYLDGIMIRTYSHQDVEELASWSSIPVINGLTDLLHPCQAMADFLTVYQRFGTLHGLKLGFIGDGNNMAHSLMLGAAKFGLDFVIACPEGYQPAREIVAWARQDAAKTGASIEVVRDPQEAARGAQVLYTDVWASMGQEEEKAAREAAFRGYQINGRLLSMAAPDSIVLHCLPAHRGEEITDEVMEGKHSAVFDEAENRLHVQKAIMALIMRGAEKNESR